MESQCLQKISDNDSTFTEFAILLNKKNELSNINLLANALNSNTNLKRLIIYNRSGFQLDSRYGRFWKGVSWQAPY